ncbi:hypothetical protein HQQ81_09860 [Microbacteriaceae bacterium VKM Ac-2854]|nr:hypothetical protein [Microbacteriaceae bacterium VKM Ac-2854]
MRFVLAIVATVIAALLIALGLGQRTIWAPPDTLRVEAALSDSAPYAIIDGATLDAQEGRQTITIRGDGEIVAAYGRTDDVRAWVGGSDVDELDYNAVDRELTASTATGTAPELSDEAVALNDAVVDPRGSDLWYEEFTGTDSLTLTVDVPSDVSVLIATDGTAPAASDITITWPLDTSTPLAGPLLLGGAVFLAIGLALYIWAFVHMRRQRGPRRKGPQGKMPKLPRSPRYRPGSQAALGIAPKGRRGSRGFVVVPVLAATTVLLAGCSSDYWPAPTEATAVATATATPTPGSEPVADIVPPVVTTAQAESIIAKVAATAAAADEARDSTVLAERFQGEALVERQVNYQVAAAGGTIEAPAPISASPVRVVLPQATDSWPRTVTAVVINEADTTIAPIALVLNQAAPRTDYMVDYAISLEANAVIPEVAPVSVGTSIVAPDSKLMKLAPEQVGSAYADILANGDASQYAALFDSTGDSLRGQVGVDRKNSDRATLPSTASIEFSNAAGSSSTVALATNDSGALVAASIKEITTVRPVAEGSTVSPSGVVQSLLGASTSSTGIESSYGYQLLFYVPPVGSEEKIVMLGWSQGIVSAVQLP